MTLRITTKKSLIRKTVSHKIDLTPNGLHKTHPHVWELSENKGPKIDNFLSLGFIWYKTVIYSEGPLFCVALFCKGSPYFLGFFVFEIAK